MEQPEPLPAERPAGVNARERWRRWGLEISLFLLLMLGLQLWQTRALPTGPAPAFSALLADGTPEGRLTSLADWRDRHPGQPVVLYFWADWCPVCKAQEGSVEELRQAVPVLTIAMQSGNPAQVAALLKARQLGWPTVVDETGQLARTYGLQGVPALLFIDAKGQLRAAAVGYTTPWGMRLRAWWAGF